MPHAYVRLLGGMFICGSLTAAEAAPASIAGSWSGTGTVGYRGSVDKVRCHARFTKTSAKSYAVSSVCTTANGRYEITGNVTSTGGGRYRGTVMSGKVSGRVVLFNRGTHLSVSVTSRGVCTDQADAALGFDRSHLRPSRTSFASLMREAR